MTDRGETGTGAPRSQRTRTVLVTFLGAIGRRMGDWMPIAGTVELMGQFGLDAPACGATP